MRGREVGHALGDVGATTAVPGRDLSEVCGLRFDELPQTVSGFDQLGSNRHGVSSPWEALLHEGRRVIVQRVGDLAESASHRLDA
ncbi:hypothetical protein LO762_09710 [Actinocorallia sp. API 0066]|uniref:hypothetical protein n=1 Tax=Actinocorallia sp. API 0066 TaxID=2896846 RepID=UPI001E40D99F|nr:hypothetical protein [Actinocorallia sp. API 0066]MCD0449464.1 hypothetical protein [Actinocorallia sp. API 0066]